MTPAPCVQRASQKPPPPPPHSFSQGKRHLTYPPRCPHRGPPRRHSLPPLPEKALRAHASSPRHPGVPAHAARKWHHHGPLENKRQREGYKREKTRYAAFKHPPWNHGGMPSHTQTKGLQEWGRKPPRHHRDTVFMRCRFHEGSVPRGALSLARNHPGTHHPCPSPTSSNTPCPSQSPGRICSKQSLPNIRHAKGTNPIAAASGRGATGKPRTAAGSPNTFGA